MTAIKNEAGSERMTAAQSPVSMDGLGLPSFETADPNKVTHVSQPGMSRQVLLEGAARYFGISVAELIGRDKPKELLYARDLTTYALRSEIGGSYEEIGRYFGGRGRLAIAESVKRAGKLLQSHDAAMDLLGVYGEALAVKAVKFHSIRFEPLTEEGRS